MSRRKKAKTPKVNEHHICFQRKSWTGNYAMKIRRAFVRLVPEDIHTLLHREFLSDVPVPDEDLLRKAWQEYNANRHEIDSYSIQRAIAWLYVHIADVEFRKAMQIQLDFFTDQVGPE